MELKLLIKNVKVTATNAFIMDIYTFPFSPLFNAQQKPFPSEKKPYAALLFTHIIFSFVLFTMQTV